MLHYDYGMTTDLEKMNGTEFKDILDSIEHRTLLTTPKILTVWELAKVCASTKGDAAEVGVWKGGSAKIISGVMKHKTTHLFDTFQGLPAPNPDKSDQMLEGALCNVDEIDVRGFLEDQNVKFYVGLFPETAGPLKDKMFCFVHADADLYQCTKDICEFFYPRMSPGGIILFDDYGLSGLEGCKLAIDEFFADKPECPVRLSTTQAFVAKAS